MGLTRSRQQGVESAPAGTEAALRELVEAIAAACRSPLSLGHIALALTWAAGGAKCSAAEPAEIVRLYGAMVRAREATRDRPIREEGGI